MASNKTPDSEVIVRRVITVTDDHDFILRVTEFRKPPEIDDDGNHKIKAVVDFKATRQNLIDVSPFFKTLLTTRKFAEAGKYIVNLDEHVPEAVEAILCAVYDKDTAWKASATGQTVTLHTMELNPYYLWNMIASARHFLIELPIFDRWFSLWYKENDITRKDHELLYPCFQFNHAEGFTAITKSLVYDCARIKEFKHLERPDLHLPPVVIRKSSSRLKSSSSSTNQTIDMLNSARGHLRVVLARWLWKKLGGPLSADCNCKEQTVFRYLKALTLTGGYPIDQQGLKSLTEIFTCLGWFEKNFERVAIQNDCSSCRINWVKVVGDSVTNIKEYFDGLCLDCMDHTKPKFLDEHQDYWNHLVHNKAWDEKCRVKHGQATWYNSFMGRADTRNFILKRAQARRTFNSTFDF
ncbi:hypothetical protein E4T39_04336 [Aureobasidium subglaciale]|nr:hypothetical protein E4T39_04336 [Aureobasidium subglaciale]